MRILHVINSLETGGAQRLVADLLTRTVKETSSQVGVIVFQDSKNSESYQYIKNIPEIKFYDLSKGKPSKLYIIKEIRKISRLYDVVHAHLFPSGYFTAIATRGLGKSVYYTEHSTHNRRRNNKYLRNLERLIYSRFVGIVAISEPVRTALSEWLKSKKIAKRIVTINNGVELNKYSEISSWHLTPNLNEATEPKLKEGQKAIIMVSRFTASKDQATVIRAIAQVRHKELIAIFVGDGETIESHKTLAVELGVGDRCCFLGTRGDVPELIRMAFIGVQSSNWEGFGLTAVEMMAGGLPVIVSDVPGLKDVVKGAGILFPRNDAEALAKELDSLAEDVEKYEAVKKQCVKRAQQFDISNTARNYIELYKNQY